jgi:hypothetical protein
LPYLLVISFFVLLHGFHVSHDFERFFHDFWRFFSLILLAWIACFPACIDYYPNPDGVRHAFGEGDADGPGTPLGCLA